ncbi:MAG TPA: hypothetical protein VFH66_04490 [Mycobacteriales bacterium]|nr:hypothetical protein [Mycobacteriales bacterium]
MKLNLLTKSALGLTAVALAATACGGSSSGGDTATTKNAPPSSASAPASPVTDTAAAQLRAGLDALLRQHVDLTAFVVQDLVAKGSLDDPQVKGSVAALQQNTNDLGDAIGQLYGDAAKKQFLDLWNAHIGFFVTYIKGDLTHSAALKTKANKQLDGYRTEFGAFIDKATGGKLPADAVAQELTGHVQTLEAAIDAIVAKSPNAATKISMAADHMDGTAAALAGGIASAKNLPGKADGAGSGLRAGLTGLLTQHVAQTGIVIETVVQTGSLTSPQTKGAIKALTANTNALGAAIGQIYGTDAQQKFLDLWNAHIGFFVDYTKGVVGKDAALKAKANKELDGYRRDFGDFIAAATNNGLTSDQVATELVGHVQTLEAAIDAIVGGQADAAHQLAMAEMHMPGTAAALAKAIAAAKPGTFSS